MCAVPQGAGARQAWSLSDPLDRDETGLVCCSWAGLAGEVEQGVPRIPNSMVTCLMHLFTCQWIILIVTIETSLNWKHTETQNSEFVKVQMFDKLNHTYFYYTMWGESSLNKKTKASWLTCWGCPAIETPHCLPPSRKVHSSSIP